MEVPSATRSDLSSECPREPGNGGGTGRYGVGPHVARAPDENQALTCTDEHAMGRSVIAEGGVRVPLRHQRSHTNRGRSPTSASSTRSGGSRATRTWSGWTNTASSMPSTRGAAPFGRFLPQPTHEEHVHLSGGSVARSMQQPSTWLSSTRTFRQLADEWRDQAPGRWKLLSDNAELGTISSMGTTAASNRAPELFSYTDARRHGLSDRQLRNLNEQTGAIERIGRGPSA